MTNIDKHTQNLEIDLPLFKLTPQAIDLLNNYYVRPSAPYLQDLYKELAQKYSGGNQQLCDKLLIYSLKGWFGYSSPILSNGNSHNGLPISCFLLYVPDKLEGLVDHTSELRWLSILGGGVAGHWSAVRGPCKKSCGVIPFMHTVDADMTAYSQGTIRRGSYAAYLDISHPDLLEFIAMRTPTGDINRKNFNLHHAVNVTDVFMQAVENDDEWALIDPCDGLEKDKFKAREIWERLLETRFRTGEPFLNFIDASNRGLHPALRAKGLHIYGSNLCNEIHLPTSKDRTAVCCLSSVNLEKYDEWKDTDLVDCMIRMLDEVLEEFIINGETSNYNGQKNPHAAKAVNTARKERSLGLGTMGWARYLQKMNIPFEDKEAMDLTHTIFSDIKKKALKATRDMAIEKGEPSDLKGYGVRNAHLLAVAPNANSSLLLGTSPSIEPEIGNVYVHRTRAGSHHIENPYLKRDLAALNMDRPDIWNSIMSKGGSVQHLENLPNHLKRVYKTAYELDQSVLVRQAAIRQIYICQGQSINLFFPKGTKRDNLSNVHRLAHKLNCKGLYYLRSTAGRSNQKLFEKPKISTDECDSCQS